MRITPDNITHLEPNEIFVFGSNLAGRHGKGAARIALTFGAVWGQWLGLYGQTCAIPTKDAQMRTLTLDAINTFVEAFLLFAGDLRKLTFLVTPIGCGLAGYKPKDIAPMFKGHTTNVILPASFQEILKNIPG